LLAAGDSNEESAPPKGEESSPTKIVGSSRRSRSERRVENSTVDALAGFGSNTDSRSSASSRMLSSMDSVIIEFADVKTVQAQKIAALEAELRTLKLKLQDGDADPQPQPQTLVEETEPEAQPTTE
jgi:hypothetical protein